MAIKKGQRVKIREGIEPSPDGRNLISGGTVEKIQTHTNEVTGKPYKLYFVEIPENERWDAQQTMASFTEEELEEA